MNPPSRIVTPERRSGEDGLLSPYWRFLSIVLISLLIWPPIFGMVAWWMKFGFGEPLLGWIVTVAIYSYVFCVPSALLAGIICAVAAIRFRNNSILAALVAAVGAAILIPILVVAMTPGSASPHALVRAPVEGYIVDLVASLIASLICWRLTRQFARTA